jgi:MoxR-like ATPase
MEAQEVAKKSQQICQTVSRFIVRKEDVIEKVMISILADGHILF